MSEYIQDTTYFRRDAHFKDIIVNGIYDNLGSITLNGQTITHFSSGGGGGGTWGTITGILNDQHDLRDALNAKANLGDLTPLTNNLNTVSANLNTLSGNVLILSAYDIQNTTNLLYLSGAINDIQSDVMNIAVVSGNWNNTYNTVYTLSSNWGYQGTDIKALTGNWENTSTIVQNYSAKWILSGTDVDLGQIPALSGNWNSVYTSYNSTSSLFLTSVDLTNYALNTSLSAYTPLTTYAGTSGVWTTVNNLSASWSSLVIDGGTA